MQVSLVTAAPSECPPHLTYPLNETILGNPAYPHMKAARVIVGLSVPGNSTVLANTYAPTGTEKEYPVTLDHARSTRLSRFFAACAQPDSPSTPSYWRREGRTPYNCIGFSGYIAGWSDTISRWAIGRDEFTVEPLGGASLQPGEAYALQDDECDFRPHAVVGVDDPLACMHVFGANGPFVYSAVSAAMREYGCTSIQTVRPLK